MFPQYVHGFISPNNFLNEVAEFKVIIDVNMNGYLWKVKPSRVYAAIVQWLLGFVPDPTPLHLTILKRMKW